MRVAALILGLVAALHAGVWLLLRESGTAPAAYGQFPSLSFSPFGPNMRPDKDELTTEEQIRSDLKVIAPYTRAIRTYGSTQGLEHAPSIAAEFGLKVTIGISIRKIDYGDERENEKNKEQIEKNKKKNEAEIESAIKLAKENWNVNAVVVGNEAILHDDIKVDDLIELIQRVKREVSVPVTTGESWKNWRDNQNLVSNVDFIAVHILPYWEGVPEEHAADDAIGKYEELRRNYPGKRIVVGEFGWPSAGYNLSLIHI